MSKYSTNIELFDFPWHSSNAKYIMTESQENLSRDKKDPMSDEHLHDPRNSSDAPEHIPPPMEPAPSREAHKEVRMDSEVQMHTVKARRRRRRPKKHHFKRYWWLYLAILGALCLIVILPIVYVAYPKIAQNELNHSTLRIFSQKATNPTPNSIRLEFVSILGSQSAQHPTIEAFGANLYMEESTTPFTQVPVPRLVHAKDGNKVNVSTTVQITEKEEFTKYTMATLGLDLVRVWIRGKTKLQEGGLPQVNINYGKLVITKGFNGLRGTQTTDINVLVTPEDDGTNFKANVFIPNPTVMTLDMGNVSVRIDTPVYPPLVPAPTNVTIGSSVLEHMVLVPGANQFPLRLATNQTQVLEILSTNSTYKATGILPVFINGLKSEYNGVEIPYFTAALRMAAIPQQLAIGKALADAGIGAVLGIGASSLPTSTLMPRATGLPA